MLTSAGKSAEAAQQYAVAHAWVRLARASGVATDLETALLAADHGGAARGAGRMGPAA
jgi:hypothetical protein